MKAKELSAPFWMIWADGGMHYAVVVCGGGGVEVQQLKGRAANLRLCWGGVGGAVIRLCLVVDVSGG